MGSRPDLHSQFTSHRKTRRDAVLWNDIAVNEDKPNDPRYNRTRVEMATRWMRSKIVNADKSGSTKVMRKIQSTRSYRVTRQRTRTRKGDSGGTKHQLHLPQALGRGALGSGHDHQLTSLSMCLSTAVQCSVKFNRSPHTSDVRKSLVDSFFRIFWERTTPRDFHHIATDIGRARHRGSTGPLCTHWCGWRARWSRRQGHALAA